MKILRIIARLNVGGPARHVVWLTEGLDDAEFDTKLIAGTVPDGEEDMAYFAEEHGVRPVYLKEMSRELSPKDAISIWKVYREMRCFGPDIVHTHTAKAGTVGRIAAFAFRWLTPGTLIGRPRKVKIVHTFHGHVFHSYYGSLKTSVFLFIERMLARFATDRIITITDQQFKEINQDYSVGQREKFRIIPLGIDLSTLDRNSELRNDFRREFDVEDDETLCGFVGRLTEIKNISMYLKAARVCVADRENINKLRFIIVGDGHLRQSLEAEAKELGIADKVMFAGNRNDIPAIYAGIDIVALTSLNEGTPLSLIEAMAAGKPVISTAVGGVVDLVGNPDEVKDGFSICERGITVESGDADGLAAGIKKLAEDEVLAARLPAAGRRFVHDNYSKDRLVNDIKEFYRQLNADARKP